MARSRLDFQELLENLMNGKVYFQPPANVQLTYPCIVYKVKSINKKYANDSCYMNSKAYEITLIDRNPEPIAFDRIMGLDFTTYRNEFVVNNLYHYVFEVFF